MGYGHRLSRQLVIVIDILVDLRRGEARFFFSSAYGEAHNFAIFAVWAAPNYPFQTFEQYVLYVLDFRVWNSTTYSVRTVRSGGDAHGALKCAEHK